MKIIGIGPGFYIGGSGGGGSCPQAPVLNSGHLLWAPNITGDEKPILNRYSPSKYENFFLPYIYYNMYSSSKYEFFFYPIYTITWYTMLYSI